MRNDIIHETIIRDIVDVIMDVKDSDEVDLLKNKREGKSFKSIASASSKLILTFPAAVDRNLNIDSSGMITKAIERKAVSMLQILFSAINVDNAENGMEFITKFHNNLDVGSMSVDKFIDTMDKIVSHEGVTVDMTKYQAIKEDMKNLNYFLPENINESGLADYKVFPPTIYGKESVEKVSMLSEADKSNYDPTGLDGILKSTKTSQDLMQNQLLNSDVKKANELAPSMMVVNFVSTSNGLKMPQTLVIGVKAKMYPVDTQDIIDRITLKAKDKNGLLKFIKATTREISFVKDFLFAIDKAKLDALSQSNKGSSSKLWKVLERRGLKSKVRRGMGHVNDAAAITTLVVSQETVEMIKKENNIDISKPKVIAPIMEAYNFMGVVLVDESMETASFLDDTGNDIYETIPFSNLEREQSDKNYKKIVNLMTKVSR